MLNRLFNISFSLQRLNNSFKFKMDQQNISTSTTKSTDSDLITTTNSTETNETTKSTDPNTIPTRKIPVKKAKKERFLENLERIKAFDQARTTASNDKETNKLLYSTINDGVKERKIKYLIQDNKCTTCWLLLKNCICPQIKNKIELKHEYIFCFHPNEWSKASNTGKIVLISDKSNFKNNNTDNNTDNSNSNNNNKNNIESFENSIYNNNILNNNENNSIGTNSKIYIMGEKNDEEMLFKRLENCSRDSTFVLFPSQNSVNIKDILNLKSIKLDNKNVNSNNNQVYNYEKEEDNQDQVNNNDNNDDGLDNDITTITETIRNINFSNEKDVDRLEKLTIIIADGTWRQAKSINKRIPEDITRIHLEFGDLKFKSMFNSLRSQPQVDRISTLEATIISMKSLGESDEVCDRLIKSLQIMIDTLVRQNSKTEIVLNKKWVGDSNVLRKNTYHNENNEKSNPDNNI